MRLTGLPVALAVILRVYRPATVVGPERLSRRQSPWPLVAAVGLGLLMSVMVQSLYFDLRKTRPAKPGAPAAVDLSTLSPGEWAFIATVPPLAGFATLWLADFFVGGFVLLDRLGVSLRRLLPGIVKGILAAMVVLPPTYLFSVLTDNVYRHFHYQHPPEHQLLKVMSEPAKPAVQWMLILAAALVAPLWEEFLFRGHIQTLIRRTLVTLSTRRPPGMEGLGGYAPLNVPLNPQSTVLSYESQNVNPTYVWQTWVAIIMTSCIFALMHPMWMRPPIFVLALGLGYCYERTGNLWANITVHCLFNSVST